MTSKYEVRVYFNKQICGKGGERSIKTKSKRGQIREPLKVPNYDDALTPQFEIVDPEGTLFLIAPMSVFGAEPDYDQPCSVQILCRIRSGPIGSLDKYAPIQSSDYKGRLFEDKFGLAHMSAPTAAASSQEPPAADAPAADVPDPDVKMTSPLALALESQFEAHTSTLTDLINLGIVAHQLDMESLTAKCQEKLFANLTLDTTYQMLNYAFRPDRIMYDVVLKYYRIHIRDLCNNQREWTRRLATPILQDLIAIQREVFSKEGTVCLQDLLTIGQEIPSTELGEVDLTL
jgi:hypothetical protein